MPPRPKQVKALVDKLTGKSGADIAKTEAARVKREAAAKKKEDAERARKAAIAAMDLKPGTVIKYKDIRAGGRVVEGVVDVDPDPHRSATLASSGMIYIRGRGVTSKSNIVLDERRDRERDTGKYIHQGGFDRKCKCGHTLGHHTADKVGGKRPCIADDLMDPAHRDCACDNFRPAK